MISPLDVSEVVVSITFLIGKIHLQTKSAPTIDCTSAMTNDQAKFLWNLRSGTTTLVTQAFICKPYRKRDFR